MNIQPNFQNIEDPMDKIPEDQKPVIMYTPIPDHLKTEAIMRRVLRQDPQNN